MTEPFTRTGALASIAAALKDWPLSLFAAVALTLGVFSAVPEFRELVSAPVAHGILFGAVAAWIFAGCRALTPAIRAFQAYRALEARVRYVITPINHQCFWHMTKQPDSSVVTQVSEHFLVKNRTDERLYLTTARLVQPKIRGKKLPGLLTMRALDSNMHGAAYVSGDFIPQKLPCQFQQPSLSGERHDRNLAL